MRLIRHRMAALALALALALLAAPVARACPACPRTLSLEDAGGGSVAAINHGDEFFSYLTDTSGYLIARDAAGRYRYVTGEAGALALGAPVAGGAGLLAASGGRVLAQSLEEQLEPSLRALRKRLARTSSARFLAGADALKDEDLPPRIPEDYAYQNDPLKGKLELCDPSTVQVPPIGGECPLMVICLSFSDVKCQFTAKEWNQRIFGKGGVSDYYTQNSNGKFTYVPADETQGAANDGVVSVTLPINRPPYATSDGRTQTAMDGACAGLYPATDGSGAQYAVYNDSTLYAYAVEAASAYTDFSRFKRNQDDFISPTELAVLVVVAGYEAAYVGVVPGEPMVWAHSWYNNNTMTGVPPLGETGDFSIRLDGVRLYKYTMLGENLNGKFKYDKPTQTEKPLQAPIGVSCHELGHDLGLMDLYDTTRRKQTREVLGLSVMAQGSWGAAKNELSGSSPTGLDPYSKIFLGFYDAETVSEPGVYPVTEASQPDDYNILRVDTDNADVYLLIENRTFTGYDRGMADTFNEPGGVVYWRINERLVNLLWDRNQLNTIPNAYAIMPEYVEWGDPPLPFRNDETAGIQRLYRVPSAQRLTLRSDDPTGGEMNVYIDTIKAPPLTGDGSRAPLWALGAAFSLAAWWAALCWRRRGAR